MAKISTVKSISEFQRAQFKENVQSKKTGQSIIQSGSSQPGRINKGKSAVKIQKRFNITAFQQQIQSALKSSSQRKSNVEITRNIKSVRIKSFVNPLSANRTINRTSKINSLISRNRFNAKNAGSVQIRPRIKSLGLSEGKKSNQNSRCSEFVFEKK